MKKHRHISQEDKLYFAHIPVTRILHVVITCNHSVKHTTIIHEIIHDVPTKNMTT